jgi:hypothetical protein
MTSNARDESEEFDDLVRRLATARQGHQQAFRELRLCDPEGADARSLESWQEYCESIRRLEDCVERLERVVWKLIG